MGLRCIRRGGWYGVWGRHRHAPPPKESGPFIDGASCSEQRAHRRQRSTGCTAAGVPPASWLGSSVLSSSRGCPALRRGIPAAGRLSDVKGSSRAGPSSGPAGGLRLEERLGSQRLRPLSGRAASLATRCAHALTLRRMSVRVTCREGAGAAGCSAESGRAQSKALPASFHTPTSARASSPAARATPCSALHCCRTQPRGWRHSSSCHVNNPSSSPQ